jgi:coenzyme F420 hydrogenase subunit beta
MDAIYQRVFGIPYDADKVGIGVVRDVFLARSTDANILEKGQDGGVVTTLLWAAIQEGIIGGAVETKMSDDKSPRGFLARTKEELLQCAGNSYEPSASLEVLNHIPEDSNEKVAVVGLSCQVTAVSNMKTYPAKNGLNIDNVKLVIGLFCGWSLSPGAFHQFLQENFDLSQVVKFDIPHHPAHTFDVYTTSGKKSIELDEIAEFINPACSYCCDMTAQFADISVGSGRAMFKGWNTVIIRTGAGADLVEAAKKKGMLEIQPLPEENLAHLRKAALIKLRKAIKKITEQTGSEQDLGYLKVRAEVAEALLEE